MACSQCDEKSDWFDLALQSKGEIIAELRTYGWKRGRDGRMTSKGDLCPSCSRKKPEAKA